MRKIIAILLICFSLPVLAQEYFLEIEKICSATGNKLEISCKDKNEKEKIFFDQGQWYGRNLQNVTKLKIIKEDEYILVLENPVLFIGTDQIHIMKKTGKFYWSQFAYSEILNENEATIQYGSLTKIKE